MIKYKLKEVKPRIFLVEFTDRYDMCMTFLRYQEYYESPNPKFRNHHFTLVDFMEWYSKKQCKDNCFEYPKHWQGFNIPNDVIENVFENLDMAYEAYNKYDAIMGEIYSKCQNIIKSKYYEDEKFYLIGAMKGNQKTINHEVAHGFYYIIPGFKKEMLALVKQLKPAFRNKLYKELGRIGYTKQVFPDEAQAFLSTGWRDYFPKLKGEDKPFIEVFEKYNKLVK